MKSGTLKRRDFRKLLSPWRSSHVVLLAEQLLVYAKSTDGQPKNVVDLAGVTLRDHRLTNRQHGTDTKRIKMQPFALDVDAKPLYEVRLPVT